MTLFLQMCNCGAFYDWNRNTWSVLLVYCSLLKDGEWMKRHSAGLQNGSLCARCPQMLSCDTLLLAMRPIAPMGIWPRVLWPNHTPRKIRSQDQLLHISCYCFFFKVELSQPHEELAIFTLVEKILNA